MALTWIRQELRDTQSVPVAVMDAACPQVSQAIVHEVENISHVSATLLILHKRF